MREETTELHSLNEEKKGITRIRPEADRNKKDWGRTWAALSNFEYIPNITCPHGIFLNIDVHGGKNCLVLDINTQKEKRENEVHEYRFFDFKDFEKAVNEMEEVYKNLNGGENKV